jgi:tetratricopeptide (TPR) repeat protein
MNTAMQTALPITSSYRQSVDESARNQRIVDARMFRLRSSYHSAEQTLRLEHENINQVWTKCVAEAKAAMNFENYDRAEELLSGSIQFSTNAQQLAYSCSFLAELYYQRKEYERAEPLCLKVLVLYEKNDESTSRADLATALHNTAFLYQAMHQFDQAEHCYLKAVQIRAEFLGVNDPLMAKLVDDYKTCIRERNTVANPWSRSTQFESNN